MKSNKELMHEQNLKEIALRLGDIFVLLKKTNPFEEVTPARRKLMAPFLRYRILIFLSLAGVSFSLYSAILVGLSLMGLGILLRICDAYTYEYFPEISHPYLPIIHKKIKEIMALSLEIPEKQVSTRIERIDNKLVILVKAVNFEGSIIKEGVIDINTPNYGQIVKNVFRMAWT